MYFECSCWRYLCCCHARVKTKKSSSNLPVVPPVNLGENDNNSEEPLFCRICYEDSVPVHNVCKCSGSIGYFCEECLYTWVQQHGYRCEVCRSIYSVVYPSMRSFIRRTLLICLLISFIDSFSYHFPCLNLSRLHEFDYDSMSCTRQGPSNQCDQCPLPVTPLQRIFDPISTRRCSWIDEGELILKNDIKRQIPRFCKERCIVNIIGAISLYSTLRCPLEILKWLLFSKVFRLPTSLFSGQWLTPMGERAVEQFFYLSDIDQDGVLCLDELAHLSNITNDPTDPTREVFELMVKIFDHSNDGLTLEGLKMVYVTAGEVLISTDCALLGITDVFPTFEPWRDFFIPVAFFILLAALEYYLSMHIYINTSSLHHGALTILVAHQIYCTYELTTITICAFFFITMTHIILSCCKRSVAFSQVEIFTTFLHVAFLTHFDWFEGRFRTY